MRESDSPALCRPMIETTQQQTDRYLASLRAVPVRNLGVRERPGTNPDEILLEVRLRYGPVLRLFRWLLNARTTKTYALAGVGREVYEDIDGKRNFEELIDRFAERHKLTFLESRALLAQYLQILTRRGIIVATMPRT